jgi:hypothetical protein
MPPVVSTIIIVVTAIVVGAIIMRSMVVIVSRIVIAAAVIRSVIRGSTTKGDAESLRFRIVWPIVSNPKTANIKTKIVSSLYFFDNETDYPPLIFSRTHWLPKRSQECNENHYISVANKFEICSKYYYDSESMCLAA